MQFKIVKTLPTNVHNNKIKCAVDVIDLIVENFSSFPRTTFTQFSFVCGCVRNTQLWRVCTSFQVQIQSSFFFAYAKCLLHASTYFCFLAFHFLGARFAPLTFLFLSFAHGKRAREFVFSIFVPFHPIIPWKTIISKCSTLCGC